MIPELLLATALAAPLDRAASTGRPIIVLLDREDREFNYQSGVWLANTDETTQKLLRHVALVFATPAEVEAWTGANVTDDDQMVRIDRANRSLAAHAVFSLAPPRNSPPEPPHRHDYEAIFALDPDYETAEALYQQLERTYTSRTAWEPAIAELTATWDHALVELLAGVRLPVRPPRALRVIGAERCDNSGCGYYCDRSGKEDVHGCGMGMVTPFTADLLKRWPPEAP